jgi:hypothetical protein
MKKNRSCSNRQAVRDVRREEWKNETPPVGENGVKMEKV